MRCCGLDGLVSVQRHMWKRLQDQNPGLSRAFYPQQVDSRYVYLNRIIYTTFIIARVCDIRLTQKMDCREKTCWSPDYYDEDTPVALPMLETEYDDENPRLLEPSEEYCKEEPNPGFCYGALEQWFYNATSGSCDKFKYTGCAGNKNNFATEAECLGVCHPVKGFRNKGFKTMSSIRDDYEDSEEIFLGDDPRSLKEDCEVSPWSDWSECSSTCGRGWMFMERSVITPASNGGRPCPKKLTKRRRCVSSACN